MKAKILGALGAAVLAMGISNPAMAAIYNYTMSNGDVLSINSTTQSASFTGATINATMQSTAFAAFTGGAAPTFTAVLSALDGTRLIGGNWITDNPLYSTTTHPQKLIMSGTGVNLWAWWGNPIVGGDYLTTITGYSSTGGNTVPEPGMLGLLGLGLVGIAAARRRNRRAAA